MKLKLLDSNKKSKGFTIAELTIATAIFGFVLLLVAGILTQIGRLYYKGIIISKTQEVTRQSIEDVANSIKFAPGSIVQDPSADPNNTDPSKIDPVVYANAICLGSTHYSYILNRRFNLSGTDDSDNTSRGLQKKYTTSSAACDNSAGTEQLLQNNMWLLDLQVCPNGGRVCDISVTIGYGTDKNVFLNSDPTTKQCRGSKTGGAFCAVVTLSTSVLKRVN